MKLRDYMGHAWDQLRRRKVVTAMCALGIAIGSSSIIVALSFGESISYYTEKQMGTYMKTDEITVVPQRKTNAEGAGDKVSYEPITKAKIDIIRSLPHVKAVASFSELGQFEFTLDGGKKGYIRVNATELDTMEQFGYEFQQGAGVNEDNAIILSYGATATVSDIQKSKLSSQQAVNDTDNSRREPPPLIAYPLYQKQIVLQNRDFAQYSSYGPMGSTVTSVKNTKPKIQIPLRVAGVLKRPAGASDNAVRNQQDAYISSSLAQKIREQLKETDGSSDAGSGESTGSKQLLVKIDSTDHVAETEAIIKKLKVDTHTNLHYKERMKSEFVILKLVFGGIGLFVLCVASISIVVAMTMSTYQRRRQIGIMKVLGANLRQIRNLFIVESSLLGILGGMFGIIASYWVIWGINFLVIQFSGQPDGSDPEFLFISPWILPVGMFFALLTGVLSGIYPAMKASKTDALTAIKRD